MIFRQSHRSGSIAQHHRVAISLGTQAVFQNQTSDPMLCKPFSITFAFMLRQASLATTGKNDNRRSRGFILVRQVKSEGGIVMVGIPQSAGCAIFPEG